MNNVKHDIPIAVKKTTMTGQELRQLVLRLFRVKVKVQYSQIHAMKEHKGKWGKGPPILNPSTTEPLSARTNRFTSGLEHGTHWIGSWVGPRARLGVLVERKTD